MPGKLRPILLRTLHCTRRKRGVRTRLIALAALEAAGRLVLRDRLRERGRSGPERRRGYQRRVDPLFVAPKVVGFDDIARKKSIAVAFRVTGSTGSTYVRPPLCPLSEAERKES
jgi:hypothetical protein